MFKEGIAKFLKLDSLMEHLTGYFEARIELLKYELKEDLTRLTSRVSVLAVILLTGMFFLLFVSVALAMLIGQMIGYFAGFGIISLLYLIAGTILFVKRETLQQSVELKIKQAIKQKKK